MENAFMDVSIASSLFGRNEAKSDQKLRERFLVIAIAWEHDP